MLSGRGLCDELIIRPGESYRLWCVVVCDLETSRMGAPYIYDISRLRVKADNWPISNSELINRNLKQFIRFPGAGKVKSLKRSVVNEHL